MRGYKMLLNSSYTMGFLECLAKYFTAFFILCTLNHFVSITLLRYCGYCIVTYALVYTFCLVTFSMFLSTVVYRVLVCKDRKKQVLQELRAVSYEDIPFLMIALLERIKQRKPPHERHAEPEAHGKTCVACYEASASITNMPCGHMVLCSACNWHFLRVSIENQTALTCSWCRTPIKDFEGAMRPNLDLIDWQDIKEALTELKSKKATCGSRNMAHIHYWLASFSRLSYHLE